MTTYCGIILTGTEDDPCGLAFITDDDVHAYSTPDDERMIELLEEHRPQVVALNAPQERLKSEQIRKERMENEQRQRMKEQQEKQQKQQEQENPEEEKPGASDDDDEGPLDPETAQMYRSGEEELVDEGHSILPQEMRDSSLLERAEFLANSIKRSGVGAHIIESNPRLVADILDVAGDRELSAYGVETEDVHNVTEFDAALLALVARFYDEDMVQEKDIVLPDLE